MRFIDDPEGAARANPASYITSSAPPFLLFHGTDDHLVSPSQTLVWHNALRAAGATSTHYVLRGANHGDLSFLGDTESGLAWSTQEAMRYLTDFLDSHLRS